MAKKEQKGDQLRVDEALSSSELFFEKYKKPIIICLSVIVLIVLCILGYHNLYLAPRTTDAANYMTTAQDYMARDSFQLALNGDNGECIGFAAIADEYSNTPSGNLARLYAGICCYRLEQYDEAVDYLKSYKASDINTAPMSRELLGNTYVELGQTDEAIKAFNEVVKSKNDVYAPRCLMKLGNIYQQQGDKEEALKAYQQIKDDYPSSIEASEVDKYIAYLQ